VSATADTIKEYLVGLGFDVDDASFGKFKGGLAAAGLIAAGVGATVAALSGTVAHFVHKAAEDLDSIGDVADLVGTTSSEVAELGAVAEQTDGSLEAVKSSLIGIARSSGEALRGVGRGALIFKKFGIEARDGTGRAKDAVELLYEVGQKIKNLPKNEQLATLSRLGIDPTLVKSITGEYSALRDEFHAVYAALGVDIDTATQSAGGFIDAFKRLQLVLDAIYKAVSARLIPQLQRAVDRLRLTLVDNLPRIVRILTPIFDFVLRIADGFLTLGDRAAEGIGKVVEFSEKLNQSSNGWFGYLSAALGVYGVLKNIASSGSALFKFLRGTTGLIMLATVAVGYLVDDYMTWKEGGESLIDWGGRWGKVLEYLGGALGVATGAWIAYRIAMAALGAVQTAMLYGIYAVSLAIEAWPYIVAAAETATWAFGVALDALTFAWYAFAGGILLNPLAWAVLGLVAAGALLIYKWQAVKDFFSGLWDMIRTGFKDLAGYAESIGAWFGFGSMATHATLAPSPAAAQNLRKGDVNINTPTTITINGAGGDAEAIGRSTGRAVRNVQSEAIRNFRGVE
jgi:hypothetical protein